MLVELRPRAAHLLLGLALLLILAPTATPGALVERITRGVSALSAGRGPAAAVELQAALELAPGPSDLSLAAAQAAWMDGQPQRALQLLAAHRAVAGPAVQAACLEAEIRLLTGDHAGGLDLLDGGPAACPAGPAQLSRLAEQLLAGGAWEPAERVLELLIERQPGSAGGQAQLGTLLATRDPQRALQHLRLAAQLDPGAAGAEQRLARAVEDGWARGGLPLALAHAGQALAAAGRWDLARQALEGAVAQDARAAGAWALLGLVVDQAGGDGTRQVETAVALAPGSAQVQLLAARHWRSRDRFDQALAALETAAGLDPDDPVVASDLASLYLAQGDLRSAEAAYLYATSVAPDDPLFWRLLAGFSLEHEVKVSSLGLPAARTALRLTPEDAQALDLLAACHYLLGNFHLADRLTWRALQLEPQLASAHYHRGLALLAQGDLGGAVHSLRQAQALDPGGRVGELASRSLANLPR